VCVCVGVDVWLCLCGCGCFCVCGGGWGGGGGGVTMGPGNLLHCYVYRSGFLDVRFFGVSRVG